MNHLKKLENKSIYILREAYHSFNNLAMLWSVGKDSTVLIRLCQKAFFGHIPFPLVHIDTGYKIPEMIAYRDKLALDLHLNMIVGKNETTKTYPNGRASCLECCSLLKTEALKRTLNGQGVRYWLNHQSKQYEIDTNNEPYTGVIVGIRSDEEGSRSKERFFSPRGLQSEWKITQQPPEFWDQFNTDFPPNTHVRIHPLLEWTEIDVWEYIHSENIPVVKLYFNNGQGKRYRSLGCAPCTSPIESSSSSVEEIIFELKQGKLANIAERSGRAQDREDKGGLETLRQSGYM